MTYAVALQAPNRQQWEANSQYSQSWNCGPTCVSFIAGFYKDSRPAIEYNRRLIAGMGPYNVTGTGTYYGCPPRTPTSAWQQGDMLRQRGVACTTRSVGTVDELHGLVDSGRRPTLIGIEMSRVPAAIRGHSFTGWHAVVIISGAYKDGASGFWVMDPNFPAGSPNSRRFYSNAVMLNAWQYNSPRWGVVPDYAKPTAEAPSGYVKFNAGVNGVRIRNGPNATADNIFATAFADPTGIRQGETVSGKYLGRTSARRKLHATVKGADGEYYYRIQLAYDDQRYVNTRFMHRA